MGLNLGMRAFVALFFFTKINNIDLHNRYPGFVIVGTWIFWPKHVQFPKIRQLYCSKISATPARKMPSTAHKNTGFNRKNVCMVLKTSFFANIRGLDRISKILLLPVINNARKFTMFFTVYSRFKLTGLGPVELYGKT